MFNFPTEKASLIKQDATTIEDIDAFFSGNSILVTDSSIPIEEGDVFTRILPNGLKEQYLVTDRGFCQGTGGIPSHYQVKVEKQTNYKKNAKENTKEQIIHNSYIVSGVGRVNINSTDNSTTIYQLSAKDEALFETLRTLAEQTEDASEIKEKIDEMEQNVGKKNFAEKYNNFIQSVANHITIFAPFIPAITQLLTQQ